MWGTIWRIVRIEVEEGKEDKIGFMGWDRTKIPQIWFMRCKIRHEANSMVHFSRGRRHSMYSVCQVAQQYKMMIHVKVSRKNWVGLWKNCKELELNVIPIWGSFVRGLNRRLSLMLIINKFSIEFYLRSKTDGSTIKRVSI